MNDVPTTGSPPMPTIVELPRPSLRQLRADLVRQRAGARDEADAALREDLRRDDADVGDARRERAGAVRPEQRDAARPQVRVDAEHVVGRDALGDADDGVDAGVGRLVDRVGGEARRHEDHRGVGAGLRARRRRRCRRRGCRRRPARPCRASRRRRPACRSRGCAACGSVPSRPVMPCTTSRVSAVTRTAIRRRSRRARRRAAAASSIVRSTCTPGGAASCSSLRPSTSLVPSRRTTIGTSTSSWSSASRMPRATSSQRVMPPKMLNRTASTLGSERMTSMRRDDLVGLRRRRRRRGSWRASRRPGRRRRAWTSRARRRCRGCRWRRRA